MCRSLRLLALILLLTSLVACGAPSATAPGASTQPGAVATNSSTAAVQETTAALPGATIELKVFAAASLTEAFTEIGKAFEAANRGVKITFNFAGSQQLAQQIVQGAPADVFASANQKQLDVVIQAGQIVSGTAQVFARNRLVVIYPQDNPAGLKNLNDLAKPGIKLDLAAKEVPVGQYALDVLGKASQDPAFGTSFKDDVTKNIVSYEENVRAILSKVTLGEVDAGIVYTSDISPDAAGKVGRIDIPDPLNIIAAYPIAPTKDTENATLAQAFIDYVLSSDGQAILVKYGFIAKEPRG